ncbi:hypothetical protein [Streptomyces bambusae]|uniref:ATP-binding protein n=1 Tax=Streptomyces bambusae TaxID=1550616 RepID=A0ABS6YYG9_9ACTN|nr:hypothetical protein [Streptomyces bambusae]MBW5480524.1 hypothetical protein [Streptomyces bambusae]
MPSAARPTAREAVQPAEDHEYAGPPAVVERTANGLPQRRRKARVTAAAEAAATDFHTAPAPATDPDQVRPEPVPQVQPGMWLAAFQSGLSGDSQTAGGRTGASTHTDASPASASKGEQP